eukprot:229782-Pyramimonas_sp.AAC.1
MEIPGAGSRATLALMAAVGTSGSLRQLTMSQARELAETTEVQNGDVLIVRNRELADQKDGSTRT